MSTPNEITEAVRQRYSALALNVLNKQQSECCDTTCCGDTSGDAISQNLYQVDELDGVPLKAALASLGCGNPTTLTELHSGETVLDFGSGGGIDVLLSARRVGPTGFAYGLDMTDEILELARRNAANAHATNVAFLKGDIAAIPLPDNSVDVIISNCVINLAADKNAVLLEAFRVLKPNGRLAVKAWQQVLRTSISKLRGATHPPICRSRCRRGQRTWNQPPPLRSLDASRVRLCGHGSRLSRLPPFVVTLGATRRWERGAERSKRGAG